jgi:Zn-dependent peptidase ImmA (M78 family)
MSTQPSLDQGEFTEGHELDRKWRVSREMIGRRLSQEEAKRLLAKAENEGNRAAPSLPKLAQRRARQPSLFACSENIGS